uniref:Putative secreted peptide n=1 Tax=Anopheles braziliensis TaxID=58242 RepID=A0A2M3ZUL2_9DIPT
MNRRLLVVFIVIPEIYSRLAFSHIRTYTSGSWFADPVSTTKPRIARGCFNFVRFLARFSRFLAYTPSPNERTNEPSLLLLLLLWLL